VTAIFTRRTWDIVVAAAVALCFVASFASPQTKSNDRADFSRLSQQVEDLRAANLTERMVKVEDAVNQIKERLGEFTWLLRAFAAVIIGEIVRRIMKPKSDGDFALKEDVATRFDSVEKQLSDLTNLITTHFSPRHRAKD